MRELEVHALAVMQRFRIKLNFKYNNSKKEDYAFYSTFIAWRPELVNNSSSVYISIMEDVLLVSSMHESAFNACTLKY